MTDDKWAEDDVLLARCKRNGVAIDAIYDDRLSGLIPGEVKRDLLQLCLNVEAAKRAENMWKVSFATAIAAALSAFVALVAVLK